MSSRKSLATLGLIAAMLVVLIGGVKLGSVVFASNNHSPSTSTTGSSTTNPFGSGERPGFGKGGQGFGASLANAAIGQVTSVSGNTITVAGFQGTSTTVTVTANTTFQKGSFQSVSAAKLSDVKVGTFVMARGTKSGSNLNATSVRIRTGGFGFRPGGNGPPPGIPGAPGSGSAPTH
jgi:hypothetical protein